MGSYEFGVGELDCLVCLFEMGSVEHAGYLGGIILGDVAVVPY